MAAPSAFAPPATDYPGNHVFLDVTIPNGQSLSPAIDLARLTLVGILMPAAWTAAAITFQASPDGVVFGALFDKTGEVSVASASAAAGQFVQLDWNAFVALRFLK